MLTYQARTTTVKANFKCNGLIGFYSRSYQTLRSISMFLFEFIRAQLKKMFLMFSLIFSLTTQANAAVLNIASDGTLLGASGISIPFLSLVSLYDVKFMDGVVKDNVSILHNFTQANQASAALFSQVLLGDYNTNTKPINGCGFGAGFNYCSIWTPLSSGGDFTQAINYSGTGDYSTTYSAGTYANTNTSDYNNVTLAIWSVSAPITSSVPEPDVMLMLFVGLGLLSLMNNRKADV